MSNTILAYSAPSEFSRQVAVEIMGWRQKLMRGPIERPTEIGSPDEDTSWGKLLYWKRPGGRWSWLECPPDYGKDIAADFEVHRHVCAKWDDDQRVRYFNELAAALFQRHRETEPPVRKIPQWGGELALMGYYKVGDYGRAALAALDNPHAK